MKKRDIIVLLVVAILAFYVLSVTKQDSVQTLANKEISKPTPFSFTYKISVFIKTGLSKLNYN